MKKLLTIFLALLSLTVFSQQQQNLGGPKTIILVAGTIVLGDTVSFATVGAVASRNSVAYRKTANRWVPIDLSVFAVDSLKTITGVPGLKIQVQGFYVPGDLSGGDFYWDDTATSIIPGISIQRTGVAVGRWKRVVNSDKYSILWFGAKGNGINDDAPAINTALSIPGIILYFPTGTYRVSSTVSIRNGNHLIGSNKFRTIIVSDTLVKSTLFIQDGASNISVEELQIVNNDTVQFTNSLRGACIRAFIDSSFIHPGANNVVDSVWRFRELILKGFKGSTDGAIFVFARNNFGGFGKDIIFDHCTFDSLGTAGMGILGEYSRKSWSDFTMTNCRFTNCGLSPTAALLGGGFGGSLSGYGDANKIENCYFDNLSNIGFEFDGSSNCTFSNNTVQHLTRDTTSVFLSFNFSQPVGPKRGFNNVAYGNHSIDSLVGGYTIINQTNFALSDNHIKTFKSPCLIQNSIGSISGDSYENTSNLYALWLRLGSQVRASNMSITVPTTAPNFIEFTDNSQGSGFHNISFFGSSPIVFFDGSSKNNIVQGTLNKNLFSYYSPKLDTVGVGPNFTQTRSDTTNVIYQGNVGYSNNEIFLISGTAFDTTTTTAHSLQITNSKNHGKISTVGFDILNRNNVQGNGFQQFYTGFQTRIAIGASDSINTWLPFSVALSNPQGFIPSITGFGGFGGSFTNVGSYSFFQVPNFTAKTTTIGLQNLITAGANKWFIKNDGGALSWFGGNGVNIGSSNQNADSTLIFWVQSGSKGSVPAPIVTKNTAMLFPGLATAHPGLHIILSDSSFNLARWDSTNQKFVTYLTTDVVSPIKYNHAIFAPITGGTVSIINREYNAINPAGTIATLNISMPASPANNDVVYIKFTQAVTTVTYLGNGNTVIGGIVSPIIGTTIAFTFDSATSTWY